ncbi:MAG: OmpH family outer membrane protein [Spirochaetia bacterium]
MKRILLALAACIALAVPLAAQTQQVTKVGVIDFTKVLLTAYKDTKGYRDYDQARGDYNKEISSRAKDITDLQSQKLDADKAGNKSLSLSLEKTISDRQKDLDTYKRVKGAILMQQLGGLMTGPALQEIYDVVKYVAETGGYALVLRIDTDARDLFLYRIPEIDITDDVVQQIMKRQGKSSGGQ